MRWSRPSRRWTAVSNQYFCDGYHCAPSSGRPPTWSTYCISSTPRRRPAGVAHRCVRDPRPSSAPTGASLPLTCENTTGPAVSRLGTRSWILRRTDISTLPPRGTPRPQSADPVIADPQFLVPEAYDVLRPPWHPRRCPSTSAGDRRRRLRPLGIPLCRAGHLPPQRRAVTRAATVLRTTAAPPFYRTASARSPALRSADYSRQEARAGRALRLNPPTGTRMRCCAARTR